MTDETTVETPPEVQAEAQPEAQPEVPTFDHGMRAGLEQAARLCDEVALGNMHFAAEECANRIRVALQELP